MSKTKSKNNPVNNLLKKAKITLATKPKTRSQSHQTHDSELASNSIDQGKSMVIDTPDMGAYPQEFQFYTKNSFALQLAVIDLLNLCFRFHFTFVIQVKQ